MSGVQASPSIKPGSSVGSASQGRSSESFEVQAKPAFTRHGADCEHVRMRKNASTGVIVGVLEAHEDILRHVRARWRQHQGELIRIENPALACVAELHTRPRSTGARFVAGHVRVLPDDDLVAGARLSQERQLIRHRP